MLKRGLSAAAMLLLTSACAGRGAAPAAAVSVSETSLCQIDRALTYSVAPAAGANDPGNAYDTDDTVRQAIAHNARLRAACEARP